MNRGKKMERLCLQELKAMRNDLPIREWIAPTVQFQNSDFLGDWDIALLYKEGPFTTFKFVQVKSVFRRNLYNSFKEIYSGLPNMQCYYAVYGKRPPADVECLRLPNFYLILI
jgi:hypothetical protein